MASNTSTVNHAAGSEDVVTEKTLQHTDVKPMETKQSSSSSPPSKQKKDKSVKSQPLKIRDGTTAKPSRLQFYQFQRQGYYAAIV
jgi:hypothetical protein